MKLIGLAGPARSGKDTAGNYLSTELDLETYALASPIKERINDMFGWDERHADGELKEVDDPKWGFSPRKAYQLFGTEFGRALRDDMWTHMAHVKAKEAGSIIVTDVRFENEAEWIRSNEGVIVHIRRDNVVGAVCGHASEAGISKSTGDFHIVNNGTLSEFMAELDDIIPDIREYFND